MNQKPIAILGAGSFGTALALHLSRLGQVVYLWGHDQAHVQQMIAARANPRFFPNYSFPDNLKPISSIEEALQYSEDILITVPSYGFRQTLTLLKPFLTKEHRIISATKGLDQESGKLLHEITKQIIGKDHPYAVLSGPSYAREIVAELPTAVVIACENNAFAKDLVARFNSQRFRTYLCQDIIGVEIGGIVKNVLAIAIGISDGMNFGANARSALITRGLAEMIRLGLALEGKLETFIGLSGVGDLVLTCTDDQSRNRRFGLALSTGKSAEEALREINQVVEGKGNAELVVALAHKHHIEMPISESVLNILLGKITPQEAVTNLLSREPKIEG